MIARKIQVAVSLLVLAMVASGFAKADLADLPIGHLKITDGPDGKINVEARCVPTKDLIAAICAKAALTPVFSVECKTYDSVWFPNGSMHPVEWFTLLSNPGIACLIKDSTCEVRAAQPEQYDSTLEDGEILRNAGKQPEAVNKKKGIRRGLIFVNGVLIRPPYSMKVKEDENHNARIFLNNLTMEVFSELPRTVAEAAALPASGQFEHYSATLIYVCRKLYPALRKKGLSKEDAVQEVCKFLRQQNIVDRVTTNETLNPMVLFKDNPLHAPTSAFDPDYDFENGPPQKRDGPSPPIVQARSEAERLRKMLANNECVIVAKDIRIHPTPSDLRQLTARVNMARGFSIVKLECLLAEVLGGQKEIARQMAVAASRDSDAFINAINQYLETTK